MALYSGKTLICGEKTTLFGFKRRNEMLKNSEGILLKFGRRIFSFTRVTDLH